MASQNNDSDEGAPKIQYIVEAQPTQSPKTGAPKRRPPRRTQHIGSTPAQGVAAPVGPAASTPMESMPVTPMPVTPMPAETAPQPGSPNAPESERQPQSRTKRAWYRPKYRWLFVYLPLVLVALVIVCSAWTVSRVQNMERIDFGSSLETTGTKNYVIVGTDSRDGLDPDTPNAGAIFGDTVQGTRSDTIIVLRPQSNETLMMSLPRDLWVTNAAKGEQGKLNGAFNQGPANVVDTIDSSLGIPLHHYLTIDFATFGSLVDAMGGIELTFEHDTYDRGSGLLVGAGRQKLDGAQALAFVRARHYTEMVDGSPRQDLTADLGRQLRQQTFLSELFSQATSVRNPLTLVRMGNAASEDLVADDLLGTRDLLSMIRLLSKGNLESVVLPTTSSRRGSASTLDLSFPEARAVLERFDADVTVID